jgi:hypothetical protein
MDNELNRMIYGIEQSMHVQAKRQLASSKRDVTSNRIFGVFFACIFVLEMWVFVVGGDWLYFIMSLVFGVFAGMSVWLGWFFYPRMVKRWEALVQDSDDRMRRHVEMNGMPSYE